MFPCFCFSACCLVLYTITFSFALHIFSCCCSFFCCFGILLFLMFGYLSKRLFSKIWKLRNPQNDKCRKTNTLTRAVSTGVLTNSVFFLLVCLLNLCFCWTIKIVVSSPKIQKNIVLKMVQGCVFFMGVIFWKSSSFCREDEIFKHDKTKTTKTIDQFLTQKRVKFGPAFSFTAYTHIYIYIYILQRIYIYAVELKVGPRFGGFCVKNWSKSCVKIGPRVVLKNWSKFFALFHHFL